jgi:hypothetical protein
LGEFVVRTKWFFLLSAFLILSCAPLVVNSAMAFDEDEPVVSPAGADISKAQHRLYPGGRDEQNLEIQPTLAQPVRSLTGASVIPGAQKPAGGDDEPSAPAEPEVD